MAEPIDLPFGLWTQNSYSLGGANVTSWEETWARPGEYDWTIRLWRRCGIMSNYFDHLLLFMQTVCSTVRWSLLTVVSSIVVTVAGICNSVGGGVLFNIPPRWRWQISVQYAPCISGEGQSSVPFPSPHASSCRTRQLPPSLLIIRRRDAIVTAVVRVTADRCNDRLVQPRTSRLIALAVLGTKHFAATPLY